MDSPYEGLEPDEWRARTEELLDAHPLDRDEVAEVVREEWDSIFQTRIGNAGLQIGVDIRPSPQILSSYIHELVPLAFQHRYPGQWQRDSSAEHKDLVCLEDDYFSTEIKASSDRSKVFGNRSYARPPSDGAVTKKSKTGYFITANFEKWKDVPDGDVPRILLVRFGWLDYTDWTAQRADTGQQAYISREAYAGKLLPVYSL